MKGSGVVLFSLGAAIGAIVGWFAAKNKYAKLAEEEIASVKERFTVPRVNKTSKAVKDGTSDEDGEEYTEYVTTLKPPEKPVVTDYTAYAKKEGGESPTSKFMFPDVIPSDVYENDRLPGYSAEEGLVWYAGDCVLYDEGSGEIIDPYKWPELIGIDTLDRFDESGFVYVVNHNNHKYYRIRKVDGLYYD